MRLSLLFTTVLLVYGILATPNGPNANVRRRAGPLLTPLQSIDRSSSDTFFNQAWTGIGYQVPPPGWNFTGITALFQVPRPSVPSGKGDGRYTAGIWVGIDGFTSGPGLWQAGIELTVRKSGNITVISYRAWYEWFPEPPYFFWGPTNQTIEPKDNIRVDITTSSPTTGSFVLTNQNKGWSFNKTVTSNYTLGFQNAEWVVEGQAGLGALPDWGTVSFTYATATISNGTTQALVWPGRGDHLILRTDDGLTNLSSVTANDTKIMIKYI